MTEFATEGSTGVVKSTPSGSRTSGSEKRFNFTKKALDRLPLPTNGQRAYYYDSATRGLALAVSPAGKKTFVLYRKIQGRPERVQIGAYPDLSIEQARGKAGELNGKIARGVNPASDERLIGAESTLGELFKDWLAYSRAHKKAWRGAEKKFENHLAAWRTRKLSTIQRKHVAALHQRIGEKRPYMANRILEMVRAMFNYAASHADWEGQNPAARLEAFEEEKRERFLQPEELPYFFAALSSEPSEKVQDFVLLSLLTGARRSNVQSMRWEEFSFATEIWTIPAEKAKAKKPINVVLGQEALEILHRRKESSESEWVFPSRRSESGHLEEPKAIWSRILERAGEIRKENWLAEHPGKTENDFAREFPGKGFTDLRMHDLRRTLGSWQAITGASLPVIGKSLGHNNLAATEIYARLHLDPVRESVGRAVEAMKAAGRMPALLGPANG